MMHRSSTTSRVAFILAAVLSAAAATPAAAQQTPQLAVQQPAASGVAEQVPAVQAGAPSAPLPGPRVSPGFFTVQPNIAERSATAGPMAPARNHTIVISTLALVLIVVLATILVVG
jgi:hypothetical protein